MLGSKHISHPTAPECLVPNLFKALELQNAVFQTYLKPWSSRMLCSKHIESPRAPECFVPNILATLELQNAFFVPSIFKALE